MPNVPVYSTSQVAPSNLPDAREQTPYRLMQAAEAGPAEQQKFGQAVTGVGLEMMKQETLNQIQQNEIAAKNHDTAQVTSNDAILHGSDDGTVPGFLSLKGNDAVTAFDDTVKKIKQVPVDLSQNLSNPAQQQLVQNTTQMRIDAALNQVKQHRDQQMQVANTTASQVRAKVGADSAAKGFNPITDTPTLNFNQDDPSSNSAYQQSLQTVASETRSLYAGLPQDVQDAKVKEALANTYVNTLAFILGGKKGQGADPGSLASAKQYFDKVRDDLSPEQIDKIQPVLDASNKQDQIVTVQRALENTPGTISARRKLLGDSFDSGGSIGGVKINGEIYQHATAALDRMEAKQRSDDDRYTASAVGQAQDFLIRNPGAAVTDLPRNLYVALEQKGHLAALDSFANREATAKTNPTAWFNVQTHFGDGSDKDIGKMSDTDWMQMRSVLSDHDWKSWSTQRDALKDGTLPAGKDPGNLHTAGFNAALNNRIISLGINPAAAKTPEDKERIGAIQQFATQWVISDQQAAGKRFNQEETQKSLDRLFATNVQFRNSFLGFSTGSTSQRMMTMTSKDLPSGAYEGIKQDLIKGGNANPTDRDIMLQYWSLHGRH